jgi:hypothetical protein
MHPTLERLVSSLRVRPDGLTINEGGFGATFSAVPAENGRLLVRAWLPSAAVVRHDDLGGVSIECLFGPDGKAERPPA